MFNYSDVDFDDSAIDNSSVGIDIDGDGVVDIIVSDTNHDGIADSFAFDSDGDGTFDSVVADTDYDGKADFIASDLDNNGSVDVIASDVDGDGNLDVIASNNGHGSFDLFDYNSSQTIENSVYTSSYFDYPRERCFLYELEQYNPYQNYNCVVHGSPESSMNYWEYQANTNRCALYSQKFIIEELTGREIDIEEIARISEENSWFSEEYGTSIENMNRILDYYGVDNEISYGNSIEDIKNCLDAGNKVIVSIDADEIWYGELDSIFTPGDGVNHAVEVIGVIDSPTGDNMVVLNDSGNPHGKGVMVPMDAFVDAWEDGSCQMVTCLC